MLDQLSKNITRCGLSNSTLNYLRVSLWAPILALSPLVLCYVSVTVTSWSAPSCV